MFIYLCGTTLVPLKLAALVIAVSGEPGAAYNHKASVRCSEGIYTGSVTALHQVTEVTYGSSLYREDRHTCPHLSH